MFKYITTKIKIVRAHQSKKGDQNSKVKPDRKQTVSHGTLTTYI